MLLPLSFLPGPSPHLRLWLLAFLCLLTDVHTYLGNCNFHHIHRLMGSPGYTFPQHHSFISSCSPNSLFQLIRSPTISFALAGTFLPRSYRLASYQTLPVNAPRPAMSVGWWFSVYQPQELHSPEAVKLFPSYPHHPTALAPCPRFSVQEGGHCKAIVHKHIVTGHFQSQNLKGKLSTQSYYPQ